MRTVIACGLFIFFFLPNSYCQITLNVSSVNPSCGYNNGSISIIASGGTAPYTYSLNGNIQNNGYYPGINAYGNGLYNITVTDAAGKTANSQIILTDALPPPILTVQNVVRPTTCTSADGQITVIGSAGVGPYLYSMDGINFTSNNVFPNLTGGTYYFFVQDANGCIAKMGYGFIGEFIAQNSCGLFCNGEGGITACVNDGTLDIVAEAITGVQPFLYSIDGINYQPSPYPNESLDFTNLPSGLYHLYVKDAAGTVVVSGYQLLQSCTVKITYVSVDATCGQSDGSLSITATNGTAPYTYTIDGINYQTSNTFTGLAKGNYSVSVKDATGGIYSLQVMMYDKCPTVSVMTTDETCGQKNGTLTATGLKGTAPYSYSIDGINFQIANIFTGLPAGNYTLTLKDANGFTATTTVGIKNNCMQVTGTVIGSTCGNTNGEIDAAALNGTAPYLYSIDGINFQSGNVFASVRAGAYTLYATDAAGLSATTPLTITDAPGPQISLTTTPASCQNTNGIIQINATGGKAPLNFSNSNGAPYQAGNIFSGLDSGLYIMMAKDANGCTASTMIDLTALLTPVFSLGNDTTLCNGESVVLGSLPIAGDRYLWQDNTNSNQYTVVSAGTYSLTITNPSGCSLTKSVKVNYTAPPVFSIGNDTSLCDVEPLTLQPTPALAGNYLWSTGSQSANLPVFTSGSYSLTINENGCSAQRTVLVRFKPTPMFILGADTTLCEGQSLTLDVTTPNAKYAWQDGSTGPAYTITKPGRYAVQVDENGCGTASSVVVSYASKPVVIPWTDTTICVSQNFLVDATYPQSNYLWQDGSTQPTFNVQQEGTYSVDVSNVCGSTTSSLKVSTINCACKFFIPNIFTPNHDGKNDLFTPKNQCQFSEYEIKIFNRWGQMVFSTKNISVGWDGNMGGIPQPEGTYVWMLQYTDNLTGKHTFKNGTVILLR
jgi:gliding motility-associated-like protein